MDFLEKYKYVIVPMALWLCIQIFKIIYEAIKNKTFDFKRIIGAGGMPSAHSAVVTSLATLIGRFEGIDSCDFAIAFVFACVVMYDAAGVRRATGEQARLLNKMVDKPNMLNIKPSEKLIENIGHTPMQVIAGAIIGFVVGLVF